MRKEFFIASLVVLSVLVACGGSDIGDTCDEEGQADSECVDGAVCGREKNNVLMCLKQCTSQADCGPGQECNGISKTNLKGCRTR